MGDFDKNHSKTESDVAVIEEEVVAVQEATGTRVDFGTSFQYSNPKYTDAVEPDRLTSVRKTAKSESTENRADSILLLQKDVPLAQSETQLPFLLRKIPALRSFYACWCNQDAQPVLQRLEIQEGRVDTLSRRREEYRSSLAKSKTENTEAEEPSILKSRRRKALVLGVSACLLTVLMLCLLF